jgi:hypothetical protein
MSQRHAGVGVAFLAAAILLTGSAVAAEPGQPILDSSLKKNGPFGGSVFVKSKETEDAYIRVTSTYSDQTAVITQESVGSADDYKFKWFRGNEDISHDVRTAGYEFELPAAGTRKFRVQIKPRVNKPDTACVYTHVAVDNPPFVTTTGGFVALHKSDACVP